MKILKGFVVLTLSYLSGYLVNKGIGFDTLFLIALLLSILASAIYFNWET